MNTRHSIIIAAALTVIAPSIAPAWNITIAEIADRYDASATTVFQPELVIKAWGDVISNMGILLVAILTHKLPK